MDMLRLLFLLVRVASRRLKRWIQQRGSDSWPIADGQVFQAETRKSDLAGWVCELTYSYSAAGEYYSGTYERGFSRKKRAEPVRRKIPGRYAASGALQA